MDQGIEYLYVFVDLYLSSQDWYKAVYAARTSAVAAVNLLAKSVQDSVTAVDVIAYNYKVCVAALACPDSKTD